MRFRLDLFNIRMNFRNKVQKMTIQSQVQFFSNLLSMFSCSKVVEFHRKLGMSLETGKLQVAVSALVDFRLSQHDQHKAY